MFHALVFGTLVDTLLAKHVAALGGVQRIAAIRSYVKHGTYREGTFFINNTYVAQMRPFYRVIGDPSHRLTDIHEGYDGSAWEYYPDPGIVLRTGKEAARTARHAAMNFIDQLVDYRAQGTHLEDGGQRMYFGRRVHVLHAVLADGFREDLFLDAQTYTIDGRARLVPMHAFGKRYQTFDVYSDYRPEGGVMMFHADKEIDSATGRLLDEGTGTSIEISPKLDVSMFHPPAWTKTPLQQMIDLIYNERDDSIAVMQTYRDFGALLKESAPATGDAMGQTKTAVALLTQNVNDHPGSERARRGLERAQRGI